jgi:divalent metal cation (Fe/Co/Zn/Cd) transporter
MSPHARSGETRMMAKGADHRTVLLRRGYVLEGITLGWNVAGVAVLAVAALAARSVALGGFGLDSLVEIGASTVVIWELSGAGTRRREVAMRMLGIAFFLLAAYLAVQGTLVLLLRFHARHSPLGIAWTAATAVVMLLLASGKEVTGRLLDNPVLRKEGRVTLVDGLLAAAVLAGLVLNAALGWWWADPLAGYVLLAYGLREGIGALVPRDVTAGIPKA